jgi:hypothetical protein
VATGAITWRLPTQREGTFIHHPHWPMPAPEPEHHGSVEVGIGHVHRTIGRSSRSSDKGEERVKERKIRAPAELPGLCGAGITSLAA